MCIVAVLELLWAVYRLRLRVLRQRQILLERNQELLQRHHGEITALNERLMTAQEEERSRIAAELHDGVLQQITVLSLQLGAVKQQVLPNSEVKEKIIQVQKRLIEVGSDIRQLSHELHPPVLQQSGLAGRLLPIAMSSTRRTAFPFVVRWMPAFLSYLSPPLYASTALRRKRSGMWQSILKREGSKFASRVPTTMFAFA